MRFPTLLMPAALLLLLSPVSSHAISPQEPLATFTSTVAGFSLDIPGDWDRSDDPEVLKPFDPSGSVVFMALRTLQGGDDKFAENVNIAREKLPLGVTIKNYGDLNVAGMKKALVGFKDLGRKDGKVGKFPATFLTYSHEPEGMSLKALVVFIPAGRTGYAITCTAPKGTFDRYRPLFERMIASFRPPE